VRSHQLGERRLIPTDSCLDELSIGHLIARTRVPFGCHSAAVKALCPPTEQLAIERARARQVVGVQLEMHKPAWLMIASVFPAFSIEYRSATKSNARGAMDLRVRSYLCS